MLDLNRIVMDGLIFSVIGSLYLVALLMIDNRMFLTKGDYPDDVLAAVPPRTSQETRNAAVLSAPWFLWTAFFPAYSAYQFVRQSGEAVPFWLIGVHIFLVLMSFWLVDLVVLDGIMFCWITPRFVVIPGTEGFAGYKDFGMHLRGHFYKGIPYLVIFSLVLAGLVWLIL